MNGSPIGVSSIADSKDATVVFTEKEYLMDEVSGHPVDRLRHDAGLVRGWGDCYGHMLVASGRAEVAVDKIMSPWDCAALIPIVREAGGCCFDYRGETTISGAGLVSANMVMGRSCLRILPQAGDQRRASAIALAKLGPSKYSGMMSVVMPIFSRARAVVVPMAAIFTPSGRPVVPMASKKLVAVEGLVKERQSSLPSASIALMAAVSSREGGRFS